ncbi:MAG: hypothetical protein PHO48_05155 [Candidatus Gracilibacteria bacterium]|nr:hypothetical protein [Candidatus Gracilibacteria bacterium]MDD5179552.1 hypothetical protein [Candidatus Gracilibacteria bacterium]
MRKSAEMTVGFIAAVITLVAATISFFSDESYSNSNNQEIKINGDNKGEIVNQKVMQQATQKEESDEKDWQEAQAVLSKFFRYTNLERFEDLRSLFAPKYSDIDKKIQEAKDNKANIIGSWEVSNLERVMGESDSSTKVFKYKREYKYNLDKKLHSEILKTYLSKFDNEWKIIRFEVVYNEYK